jgi:hypothetical protein
MTQRYSTRTDARYWTETPRTVAQATDQRYWREQQDEARSIARQAPAIAQAKREADAADFLKTHPEIGILQRKGGKVYYVFEGSARNYREATDPRELVN